jgi:transcriptional regulator with XRE-family HTH domain
VGEHLLKARLDLGIQQRDAARALGCDPGTLLNWEKGRVAPDVRFWPAILRYLGYDPRPAPAAFGGRLRAAREAEGLSHRELARRLGLDPGTVAAWERDEIRRPYPRIRRVLERWLASVRVPPRSGVGPGDEINPEECQAEGGGEE